MDKVIKYTPNEVFNMAKETDDLWPLIRGDKQTVPYKGGKLTTISETIGNQIYIAQWEHN